jgi:hypothetical protein
MSKFAGGFGLLALGLLAVYGCSSDEKSDSSGTTASGGRAAAGGGRSTGGSGVNPVGCPATQPADGTACTNNVLSCTYGNQICNCDPVRGGQGGQGGQAQTLAFQCELAPDAGAGGAGAGTCDQGETCDPVGSTCVNADAETCTCLVRRGEQTYVCDFGGGGFGPGTGGSGVAGGP